MTEENLDVEWLPIEEIKRNPDNPKDHNQHQIAQLAQSIIRFGWTVPLITDGEHLLLAGHGRLMAAESLGLEKIPVLIKPGWTEDEARAYMLLDNRLAEIGSSWNEELLRLNIEALEGTEADLGDIGVLADFEILLTDPSEETEPDDEDDLSNIYSRETSIPLYEPKGDQPAVSELFSKDHTEQLEKEINRVDIPQDIRHFLMAAAARHTVFNYERIADFYAHSEPEIQRLMEDSALVIIDFDRAIELGYVRLGDESMELYREDVEKKGDDREE